ncbi:MAG TPA: hypothetical protein VF210_01195 [Pseudomonadales bacterium]
MKRVLVLLHGSPGAGKSTLARGVAEMLPDLYYADMGRHPEFGRRPMFALCAELYEQQGNGGSLITEGVLPNASSRDRLVSRLISRFRDSTPFDSAVILHVVVPPEVLATRRRRSVEDYERMARAVQAGSSRFEYDTFEATTSKSCDTRRKDIERLAEIIERRRSYSSK